MSQAHAPCACSAAERWMHCPGSVGLNQRVASIEPWVRAFPPRPAPWLDRGTRLHAVAAVILSRGVDLEPRLDAALERLIPDPDEGREDDEPVDEPVDETIPDNEDVYDFEEDRELVRQFCAAVRQAEILYGVKAKIETRVRPFRGTDIDHLCWGSLDVGFVVLAFGILHVFDFKSGSGVTVQAWENPQLMLYARGLLTEVDPTKIQRVNLTIIQPSGQGEPVKTFQLSREELDRRVDVMGEAVRATVRPDAPLAVGPWCRFCPAIDRCPAVHREMETMTEEMSLTVADELVTVTPERAAEILKRWSALKPLRDAVYRAALEYAATGRSIDGMHLKARRRRRSWALSEPEIARHLIGVHNIPEDKIFKRKLVTPAQAEKLLPGTAKKRRDEIDALSNWTTPGANLVPIEKGEPPPTPRVSIIPRAVVERLGDAMRHFIQKAPNP